MSKSANEWHKGTHISGDPYWERVDERGREAVVSEAPPTQPPFTPKCDITLVDEQGNIYSINASTDDIEVTKSEVVLRWDDLFDLVHREYDWGLDDDN